MTIKFLTCSAAMIAGLSFVSVPVLAQEAEFLWDEQTTAQLAGFEAMQLPYDESALTDEAAINGFIETLPDYVTLEVGSFTPEGDGVVAKDFVLSFDGLDGFSIEAGEARFYGLNPDFFDDIAAGEASLFAERIDLRQIEFVGLETGIQKLSDGYIDAYEGALTDFAEAVEGEGGQFVIDQTIEEYTYQIDRMIVDGFVWHPASEDEQAILTSVQTAAMADDASTEDQLWYIGVVAANVLHSVEMDRLAMFDVDFHVDQSFVMSSDFGRSSQRTDAKGAIGVVGYSGIDQGNFDLFMTHDMMFIGSSSMDIAKTEYEDAMSMAFDMAASVDLATMEDMQLKTLMGYLKNKQIPGRDITDLMSLGVINYYGAEFGMGDDFLIRSDRLTLDLSDFHWFAPQGVLFEAENAELNLGAYLDYIKTLIQEMAPDLDENEQQAANDIFEQIVSILEDHDADILSGDLLIDLDWNAVTGDTVLKYREQFDGFWSIKYDLDIGFLTLDDVVAMFEADTENSDEPQPNLFEVAMMDHGRFTSFDLVIEDQGGLDKVFSMVFAFSKLAPEDDPTFSYLQALEPDELRMVAASGIRILTVQTAKAFPPATDYLNAFADFVEEGGTFEMHARPEQPVTMESMETLQSLSEDPDALVEYLRVSVVHTPPVDQAD